VKNILPRPGLGDMIKFKDVRMDGSIRSEHFGLIYEIIDGQGYIAWVDNFKPYDYNEIYGYSVVKMQQEYDVFSVVAKASDAKSR